MSGKRKTTTEYGFTLAELLIVVAIIAVLVAISIPILNTRLEKSRESTDIANMRSAYALAVSIYTSEDEVDGHTFSEGITFYYDADKGVFKAAEDGIEPYGKGTSTNASLKYKTYKPEKDYTKAIICAKLEDERVTVFWNNENGGSADPGVIASNALDVINKTVNESFKTYNHSFINSHEKQPNGGTEKLMTALTSNAEFENLEAKTWAIYPKVSNSSQGGNIMYWSSLDVDEEVAKHNETIAQNAVSGFYIPVIAYNESTKQYDVYRSRVTKYNDANTGNYYYSLERFYPKNGVFQFDSYESANSAYQELLKSYNAEGTVSNEAMANNKLDDVKNYTKIK